MHPPSSPQELAPRGGGPSRPGFAAGVRAFFGGFASIAGDPGAWPLAAVPVLVALTLIGLLGWVAVAVVPAQVEALLGPQTGRALPLLLQILATGLTLLVAVLAGFALAQPLSGPALERIVRRIEHRLGAPAWPDTSFLDDILRSLQSVVVSFAFGLPILAALVLVNLIFPPAVVVTIPLKLAVAALLLAWDLCDYPLSLRGVPIGARVAFLRRNAGATLGFGFGLALLGLVPCLLVLVLPAGVAGAARLVVDLERWEAAGRGGDRPT
jgi:CysZ protein